MLLSVQKINVLHVATKQMYIFDLNLGNERFQNIYDVILWLIRPLFLSFLLLAAHEDLAGLPFQG